MKKKNKFFMAAYWAAICTIIFACCANKHSTEEKIMMENQKELNEEKMEKPEMESGSDITETDAGYSVTLCTE